MNFFPNLGFGMPQAPGPMEQPAGMMAQPPMPLSSTVGRPAQNLSYNWQDMVPEHSRGIGGRPFIGINSLGEMEVMFTPEPQAPMEEPAAGFSGLPHQNQDMMGLLKGPPPAMDLDAIRRMFGLL